MRLAPGTRLGPYEILTLLGAGGMGEVYKARDTRLDRAVALKILSTTIAASPEARQRFEREARAISQLTHPHICALYDIGREPQVGPHAIDFLVMELLEGETLASRLAKGALPLEQTLRHGLEIADALDKAHRHGIVHRDLKPANVMITKSGVKLLDFGLAKAMEPIVTTPVSIAETTPRAQPITAEGAIAGTVQYMAPEQIEGRPADARSDIFALGAVIYEMATGKRAFSSLDTLVPGTLDRIVRTCLAKDPDERWQSSHDVRLQLGAIADGGLNAAMPGRRRWTWWLPWAIAAGSMVLGAWLGSRALTRAAAPVRSTARFAIPPPEGGTFVSHVETLSLALSPDGSQLAFVASDPKGGPRIWLRKVSSLDATPIAGTDGAITMSLFWSPDSRSIGFFSRGKLKRLDLQSWGIVTVCSVPENIGLFGTWGRDGRILFASVEGSAIFQVSMSGGTPTEILRPDRAAGEARLTWPWFLPDGDRFLYSVRLMDGGGRVMLAEPSKPPRQVLTAVSNVQYTDPGYLVFANEGTLVAQRFDLDQGRVTGDPFAIAQPIRYFYSTATGVFTVSRAGAVVYQSHADEGRLVWYDRSGSERGAIASPGQFNSLRLSPDGTSVAFASAHASSLDLWRADLARGVESRLTADPGSEFGAVWHPDGRTLFFAADRKGPPHLFRRDLATGADTEVQPGARFQQPEDVSPDGRTLLYTERSQNGTFDLWTAPVTGNAAPSRLFDTPFTEAEGRFSPDGRWFAYLSNESGALEAYVAPFPPTGEKTRVSIGGASSPRWSRDGRELFYLSNARDLVVVSMRTSPSLEIGAPTTLFALKGIPWRDFDVSIDGRRFLAHVPERSGDQQPLTAVLDWTAEVKK